jgi:hypothetical protein
MRFKPRNCKGLQGAADTRRQVRRRPFDLQVLDNKVDAMPCKPLRNFHWHRLSTGLFFDVFRESSRCLIVNPEKHLLEKVPSAF